jgi:hypothetical protein
MQDLFNMRVCSMFSENTPALPMEERKRGEQMPVTLQRWSERLHLLDAVPRGKRYNRLSGEKSHIATSTPLQGLVLNSNDLPRLDGFNVRKTDRHERQQVFQTV